MGIQGVLGSILSALPMVLMALLQIVLGIIVALIVRAIILKLGKTLKLEEKLDKIGLGDTSSSSLKLLANLVALIIFILFVPGILGNLGLSSIIAPINAMMISLLSFIPQLLGAAIIIAIGYFVAKIIKQVVTALLKKTKLDSFQDRLGVKYESDSASFSVVIGNILFALIFIPIIISALDVLKITSISGPAVNMLTTIFNIIPYIFVAIVLIVVGVMIAKLVYSILTGILTSIGTDNVVKKIIRSDEASKFSLVKIINEAVRAIIIVLFVVQALNVLKLDFMSNVGNVIVSYLPSLVFAFVIMIVGYLFASWLKSVIDESSNGGKGGAFAKTAILVLTGFIILNQLGFAMVIVNYVFIIVIAALALAFAIAFGIGGRDFAARTLSKIEHKMDDKVIK